uniref:WD repeat-containing protein 91 n=1 Tax=Cacopsylla melanoneura TaxID=428564 RepID=A0A8D8S4D6_9HEMI
MTHIQYVDELIREYLLFRGFAGTLKMFDIELKQDKEKGFRVDRIVDQFLQLIYSHDLNAVREFWHHLHSRMFSKLEIEFTSSLKKLENGVLKLFLVNAICNNKPEKVTEFLNKMAPELQHQAEWKEWFLIPFIKNPEENPSFSLYFSRQWQDTLLISLHNFLACVYQVLPQPTLSGYEEEVTRLRRLTEENEMLRQRLSLPLSQGQTSTQPPLDLMDDFYNIAQETPTTNNESQVNTLKNLIRSIGGGGGATSNPVLSSSGNSMFYTVSDSKPVSKQRQNSTPSHQMKTASPSAEEKIPHLGVAKRSASVEGRKLRDSSSHTSPSTKTAQSFLVLSQENYTEHKSAVTQVKFNSSGSQVASGDVEGQLKIWTPSPVPKTLCSVKVSSGGISCIDWVKKNERYLMVGTDTGSVHLIDGKDARVHWESSPSIVNSTENRVACLACNPVGSTFTCSIVSVSKPNIGALLRFEIKTKKMEHITAVDSKLLIFCLTYNHSGHVVLAGGQDGALYKIDVRQNQILAKIPLHDSSITGLRLHQDNVSVYTMSSSQIVRSSLNDVDRAASSGGACHWDVGLKSNVQHVFCLNQAGTHLLLISNEVKQGTIYKIKRSGMEQVLSLNEHKDKLTACDWRVANQCGTCLISSHSGVIMCVHFTDILS